MRKPASHVVPIVSYTRLRRPIQELHLDPSSHSLVLEQEMIDGCVDEHTRYPSPPGSVGWTPRPIVDGFD